MQETVFAQSVLITGANRGMGLGYVMHYLKKGISVLGTIKTPQDSFELISLQKEYPNQLKILELNIESEDSIDQLANHIREAKATFSIAINNAGVSIEEAFGEWTMSNFERHFRINAIGPALVSQAVVPFMEKDSKMIQISSGMGSQSWNINPQMSLDAYAMSKCSLHSLTVRLAEKLKEKRIIVVAINPGWVKTAMGGDQAPTLITEAVSNIANTIENISYEQTGSFLSDKGEQVPW